MGERGAHTGKIQTERWPAEYSMHFVGQICDLVEETEVKFSNSRMPTCRGVPGDVAA